MTAELFDLLDDQVPDSQPSPLVLSRLVIEGFWGSKKVDIRFDSEANFLIGPNGCGKTTIVNLLAACLAVDYLTLDRVDFARVEIELSDKESNARAADVNVFKSRKKNTPYSEISYSIYDRRSASRFEMSLDLVEEQAFRSIAYSQRKRLNRANSALVEEIRKLCSVTWLSVHRSDLSIREREERAYDSLVDMKIDQQSNALVRYFSRLDQLTADALKDFQQVMFLSLLADEDPGQWFSGRSDAELDKEKDVLLAIFDQFSMQRSKFASKVEKHFGLVKAAAKKLETTSVDLPAIAALISQSKIHEIVAEWRKFQSVRSSIYKLRNAFVSRVNSMLIDKEIFVNKANEVAVRTNSGRGLSVKALSSGEKQLLIIMGEALLQEGRPVIYIADEPELSLHVAWQEMLVTNIREINENAQIVFATHSPDIVSSYNDRVIKALEVIGNDVRKE